MAVVFFVPHVFVVLHFLLPRISLSDERQSDKAVDSFGERGWSQLGGVVLAEFEAEGGGG